MALKSTLFYSVDGLGSNIQYSLIDSITFATQEIEDGIYKLLKHTPAIDVKQDIVDNILKFADSL